MKRQTLWECAAAVLAAAAVVATCMGTLHAATLPEGDTQDEPQVVLEQAGAGAEDAAGARTDGGAALAGGVAEEVTEEATESVVESAGGGGVIRPDADADASVGTGATDAVANEDGSEDAAADGDSATLGDRPSGRPASPDDAGVALADAPVGDPAGAPTDDGGLAPQDDPIPSRPAVRHSALATFYGDSTFASGSVAVYARGDIDKDGMITQADMEALLKHVNGYATLAPFDTLLADVNGSGLVNSGDCADLLRYANDVATPALGFVSTFTVNDGYLLDSVSVANIATFTDIPAEVGASTTQKGCTLTKTSANSYLLNSGANAFALGAGASVVYDTVSSPRAVPQVKVEARLYGSDAPRPDLGTAAAYARGDVDKNGLIEASDFTAIANAMFGTASYPTGLDLLIADAYPNGRLTSSDLSVLRRYLAKIDGSLGFVATDNVVRGGHLDGVEIYLNGSGPTSIYSVPENIGDTVTVDGFTLEKRSESEYWVYNASVEAGAASGQVTTVSFIHLYNDRNAPGASARALMCDGGAGGGTAMARIRGDFDGDGVIAGNIVRPLLEMMYGLSPTPTGFDFLVADVDGSGRLSANDITMSLQYLTSAINTLSFVATDTLDSNVTLVRADVYSNDATTPIVFASIPAAVGDAVNQGDFKLEKTAADTYLLTDQSMSMNGTAEFGKTTRVDFIHERRGDDVVPPADSDDDAVKPGVDSDDGAKVASATKAAGTSSILYSPQTGDSLAAVLVVGGIAALAGACLAIALVRGMRKRR